MGAGIDDERHAMDPVAGWRPGVLGAIVTLHAVHYARVAGFGPRFEAVVAAGLADFVARLEAGRNALWTVEADGRTVASIAIDGEDLGGDIAHLRWFIVEAGFQGRGLGRRLLRRALAFCDGEGFAETRLWTFEDLEVARRLYERHGFVLQDAYRGEQWGTVVTEQRFGRLRPLPAG